MPGYNTGPGQDNYGGMDGKGNPRGGNNPYGGGSGGLHSNYTCLLYTSDAADE